MATSPDGLRPVSIDGTVPRDCDRPLHGAIPLVSVYDQVDHLVLWQGDVGATKERKAALKRLESLVLEGQVVTGDAMFCQRDLL